MGMYPERILNTLLPNKSASVPDTALLPMQHLQMETAIAAQEADFAKACMRIMVDAHEEDVDEFEATDARDAGVRAFATRMLPTLRTHYARAKEVRSQVKSVPVFCRKNPGNALPGFLSFGLPSTSCLILLPSFCSSALAVYLPVCGKTVFYRFSAL